MTSKINKLHIHLVTYENYCLHEEHMAWKL